MKSKSFSNHSIFHCLYAFAEILRDYGFVESFPQRWHFMEENFHFDLDQIEGGKYIVTWDEDMRPTKTDMRLMEQCRIWFRWEIRRLKRFKKGKTDHGIPDQELETLTKFVDATIIAMAAGLESLGPSPKQGEVTTTRADSAWQENREENEEENFQEHDKETCVADPDFGGCMAPIDIAPLMANATHYDPFEWEYDDLDYQRQACDNKELMRFNDFDDVEWMKTHYQKLNFQRNPETDNTCMDLDNIVQICDDYRPQYHEYSTHGAGRYVKDVKRIIFIGGGDSMLLHEALKYPNLELVVGLEIDQTVVRKSFKYFRTSPHFEDERVEWWFGDATKSLLLLPEDYWGSFDLVLVDLSETVMSFSVTSELDVFDALALLLSPEGVIVKNEHYHEKFQRLFDYTAEISYESPVVCFQVMVFGSNNVDFFRDPVYDHGIETKMYESLHKPENRHDLMHGYRKNIAPEEKCNLNIPKELTTQGTAAGILEIVNAENCSVKLDESIVDIVKKTAELEGFTAVSEPVFENNFGFVVLKEGFIGARIVPEENYVGFDVNLWGMSSKIKSLKKALTAAIGSGDMSSYKVVVGGMYGSSSWQEDQKIQGPKLKQLRNCEEDVVREGKLDAKTASAIAIGETVPLTLNSAVAAVVCGKEGEKCVAYDTLKAQSNVNHVFPIYECSETSEFECENEVSKLIRDQVFANGIVRKLNLLVMDGSSSLGMHQVVGSVLESKTRESCFEEHNVVVTWMSDADTETFRREFLDRYRKICWLEPASRAEIVLKAEDKTYELGVVSSNNEKANYEYEGLQNRIKSRLSSSNVLVELRNIHGALFKYMHDWDPKTFRHEDYENKPQIKQYKNQKPLGRQNVYQLVKATGVEDLSLDTTKILSYLNDALASIGIRSIATTQYEGVGDGAVILKVSPEGYVTVVWDGREHISVNFFTAGEGIGMPEKFVKSFLKSTGQQMQIGLRDDQPRGVNRVINFPSDLNPRFRKPTSRDEFFRRPENRL